MHISFFLPSAPHISRSYSPIPRRSTNRPDSTRRGTDTPPPPTKLRSCRYLTMGIRGRGGDSAPYHPIMFQPGGWGVSVGDILYPYYNENFLSPPVEKWSIIPKTALKNRVGCGRKEHQGG